MSTDKNGLINFQNKIKKLLSSQNSIKNEVADQIASEGVEIAKSLILYQTFIIQKTKATDGFVQIKAHDPSERPHIAYVEFGTGIEGLFSNYEGAKPNFWAYYTDTDYKYPVWKWKAGRGAIVSGQVSQGNMWNVSLTLQKDIRKMKFNINY